MIVDKRIPATIVDNFFDDPDEIRNYALSLPFDCPRGLYPGIRTEQISLINPVLYNTLNSRILSLFFNQYTDTLNVTIESQFQIIPGKFETGWAHQDTDVSGRNLAGVIYLTPNAPLHAGTGIYRKLSEPNYESLRLRNEYYFNNGEISNLENYKKQRDEYNSHFESVLDIKNVYNRLIIYDTSGFHKESAMFGTTKQDARLTLVFFMTVEPEGRSQFPITRMRTAPIRIR